MLQTAELLKKVRRLEILTRRRVDNVIGGAYRSVFKGRGIEFDEVREYTIEDDVRDIDWNVSARLNAPYVKKYIEERELSVLLMVDISDSMRFASANTRVVDRAVEAAALLGLSAMQNNDRVGLALFDGKVEKIFTPRSGRHNRLRLIRELIAATDVAQDHSTNLAGAIQNACRILDKRSVIFIISDLIDDSPELEKALKAARRRHDVTVLHMYDPAGFQLPKGVLNIYDAENGSFCKLFSRRSQKNFAQMQHDLILKRQALCRRAGVSIIELPGNKDILTELMQFFQKRFRSRSAN